MYKADFMTVRIMFMYLTFNDQESTNYDNTFKNKRKKFSLNHGDPVKLSTA